MLMVSVRQKYQRCHLSFVGFGVWGKVFEDLSMMLNFLLSNQIFFG